MTTDLKWFAVFTQPQSEETAQKHLTRKGYDVWYPHYCEDVPRGRHRKIRVKKPYMSRYIFCGLGPQHYSRGTPILAPVNDAIGVSTVVYVPGGIPFPIPAPVMLELMSRADSGGEVEGTKRKRRFSGKKGDRLVLAETSPYWNFICEIQSVDSGNNIIVSLESFGRQVPTSVRLQDVKEIHTREGEIIPKGDPRMFVQAGLL